MTQWNNGYERAWGEAWGTYETLAQQAAPVAQVDQARRMFNLWDKARDIEIERVEASLGVGHHVMTWCQSCQMMVFTDSLDKWHTQEKHDELLNLGRREGGLQTPR